MSKGYVLVTGCAGFIGSHLAETLLSEGYNVIGVDCLTPYYSQKIKQHNLSLLLKDDRFKFVKLDLSTSSIDDLVQLVGKVDAVVHEAAQPGVRGSWGFGFEEYVRHNVLATQKLLEACIKAGNIKRFVFASSSSIYGNVREVPIREGVYPRPYSPYGVTKLAAESLCRAYFENYGLPVVMLRYFTVYGPRQRPDMAFHRFIRAMLEGRPIKVYGDGTQMRDFTYVIDVVKATILALEGCKDVDGEIINIGSGKPVPLIDAIRTIADIIGVEPRIKFVEPQKGDVKTTHADISKANKLLKWSPRTKLREGLEKEVTWLRQVLKKGIV